MGMWETFDPNAPTEETTQERQTRSDLSETHFTRVYQEGDKWIAYSKHFNKTVYLGRFPSQEMAYEAQQQYKETGIRTNVKKIRKSRFQAPTDDELQELIEEHQSLFPYDTINHVHKYEIHQQVDPNPTNEYYQ